MKKKKYFIFGGIFLLAIGFASVSTVLYLNGETKVTADLSTFSSSVVFSAASTTQGTATISDDGKTITYTTSTLKSVNDESVLDFTIYNGTSDYDAEAEVVCSANDETNVFNDSVSFASDKGSYSIPAKTNVDGTVTVKLVSNVTETAQIGFTCTLNVTAGERTSVGVLDLDASEVYYTKADGTQATISDSLNELFDKLS